MKVGIVFLTICCIVAGLRALANGRTDGNRLLHLLRPQLRSQIILRVPDYYYSVLPRLPLPLTLAMEFLVSEQVPFRLFYNFTQTKLQQTTSHLPRHTQNQVVRLVFVSVQSKSEVLDLHQVFQSYWVGNKFDLSTAVHEDFIQLVVDESAVGKPWSRVCNLNIARAYVPLYFVMLVWPGTYLRSQDAYLLRETCKCDGGRGFTLFKGFIPALKESDGLSRILKRIQAEKKDFRGRKVTMYPVKQLDGSWESRWQQFFLPFSFRATHRNWTFALAGLFDSFVSQHNFTLEFENNLENYGSYRNSADIHMISSISSCTGHLTQCYIPPVSLLKLEHHNTLLFRKADRVEPFSLPSLTAPFPDSIAETILLCTPLCMMIILLILRSKSTGVISTYLPLLLGLIGKSLFMRGNAKSTFCYSFWLLVGFVILVTYTSILQSYVVVPGVRYNDLSFDDMSKQNYSFEARQWKWMKATANDSTYHAITVLRAREKTLSERVSNRGKYLGRDSKSWSNFVEYYSKATKRALVVPGDETELYTSILLTHMDIVVGKEKFFAVPLWWDFMCVERGSLLASSVESFKEAGLLQYFLQLMKSKSLEVTISGSRKKELNSAKGPTAIHKTAFEGSNASLKDALISECFVLLVYGILTAIAVFLSEKFKDLIALKVGSVC